MRILNSYRLRLALILTVVAISVIGLSHIGLGQGVVPLGVETAEYMEYEVKVLSGGIVLLSDDIPTEDTEPVKLFYIPEIPLDKKLQEYTYDLCLEKNVDYELALAVMWRESRFQLGATGYNRNGTQDSGIMQINDINKKWIAEELDVTDLYDPYQNILAGVTMLSEFIDIYGEHDGLMAYGAGEAGMKRLKAKGVLTLSNVQIALDKRDEIELVKKSI